MDAKITITTNPQEFDLIRNSVDRAYQDMLALADSKDPNAQIKVRSEARKQAVLLSDLLAKLR
jgi:hypothetical protein